MHSENIEYSHSGTTLEGFFACDDASDAKRPGVLICHAWGGRDDFVIDKAKQLAGRGYAALALDMFGKGILGSGPEENQKLIQPFVEDRVLLRDRMLAGLQTLAAQSAVDANRIAAIGFCFGGLCALDLARSGADVRGVVSFHGLLMPSGLATQNIKAKVLTLHGYDDPMATPEQLREFCSEMTEAGADWQVHAYGNVTHAFTNPEANDPGMGTVYDGNADRRSWQAAYNFLEEVCA